MRAHASSPKTTQPDAPRGAREATQLGASRSDPAAKPARVFHRFAETSIRAPETPVALPSNIRGVVQRQWLDDDETGHKKWSSAIDGREWYYNQESGHMYHRTGDQTSQERPYLGWLQQGFPGMSDAAIRHHAAQGHVRAETIPEKTTRYRNFWDQHHAPHTTADEHGPGTYMVKTGTDDTYFNRLMSNQKGYYQNVVNAAEGHIKADDNHKALDRADLGNSEVLFQQWRTAKEKHEQQGGQSSPLRSITRNHIINKDTRNVFDQIQHETGASPRDRTYHSNDPHFHLLMSTPNLKSSRYLVGDHGAEMGISGIHSVHIDSKGSATVRFLPRDQ